VRLRLQAIMQMPRSSLIAVAAAVVIAALCLSAGYATAERYTASQDFCAHSCHEMESTVAAEYARSGHNRRATCAQCHEAQDSFRHVARNDVAGAEHVWAHLVGREYLPGRFEARRADLAKKVLAGFKEDNARECKGCHTYRDMARTGPSAIARRDHAGAMNTDAECMDCHRGVAHQRMDVPASFDF